MLSPHSKTFERRNKKFLDPKASCSEGGCKGSGLRFRASVEDFEYLLLREGDRGPSTGSMRAIIHTPSISLPHPYNIPLYIPLYNSPFKESFPVAPMWLRKLFSPNT